MKKTVFTVFKSVSVKKSKFEVFKVLSKTLAKSLKRQSKHKAIIKCVLEKDAETINTCETGLFILSVLRKKC